MKTKKFQKNIKKFGTESKKKLKRLNGGKKVEFSKDFENTKFESDNNLPMNKPVKLHLLPIISRSALSEDGKFYPQLFLNDALYDV